MSSVNDTSENTTIIYPPLGKNCRPEWPVSICIFFNTCGLLGTAIWFVILFPQLWKNYRRKSVIGLSVQWATATFTASLLNLCFVFGGGNLPLYMMIQAIYRPTVEFCLLVQFYIYGKHYRREWKIAFLVTFGILWAAIVVTDMVFTVYRQLQWIAIFLWCIELFPQVVLNMKRRSTSGQSNHFVGLNLVGRLFDFTSNYGLVMPLQFIVMTYFTSSMAYINGIQVAWYYGKNEGAAMLSQGLANADALPRDRSESTVSNLSNGSTNDGLGSPDFEVDVASQMTEVKIHDDDDERKTTEDGATGSLSVVHSISGDVQQDDEIIIFRRPMNRRDLGQSLKVKVTRYTVITIFALLLVVYAAGIVWDTRSYIALLAPCLIAIVLGTSKLVLYLIKLPTSKYKLFK